MTRILIAAAAAAAVRSAYVEGVHAKPGAQAMRKGFHSDFRMYVLREVDGRERAGSTRAVTRTPGAVVGRG